MIHKPYTIIATILGRPLTGHAPDPATAHAVAALYADRYADPGTHPTWWREISESLPGHVDELLVRAPSGPTHLALLPAGAPVDDTVDACCGTVLTAATTTIEERGHGIPCPLCHTAWSASYTRLHAHRRRRTAA